MKSPPLRPLTASMTVFMMALLLMSLPASVLTMGEDYLAMALEAPAPLDGAPLHVVGQGPQLCCRLQCRQVGWTFLSIMEFQSYSKEAQAVPSWKRKQFMRMPEALGLRGSEKWAQDGAGKSSAPRHPWCHG